MRKKVSLVNWKNLGKAIEGLYADASRAGWNMEIKIYPPPELELISGPALIINIVQQDSLSEWVGLG